MLYGIRIGVIRKKHGSRRRREKVKRLIPLGLSLFFIFGSTPKKWVDDVGLVSVEKCECGGAMDRGEQRPHTAEVLESNSTPLLCGNYADSIVCPIEDYAQGIFAKDKPRYEEILRICMRLREILA